MTKFTKSIYNLSLLILKNLGLIFTLLLFLSAILFSSTDTDITTWPTTITTDNFLVNLVCLIVFQGIILLLKFPCQKHPKLVVRILLAVTMIFYAVTGMLLIIYAKSMPHTDSLFVYEIALNFSKNNLEAINPVNSYLSVYPHQTGLVFYYEALLRFWNLLGTNIEGYLFLQVSNLVLVLIMLYFMYRIVQKLFQSTYTCVCYFILIIFCFPLLLYTLRVYGDIPSIAFFTVGLWAYTELILGKSFQETKHKKRYIFLSFLSIICFSLSVATRKNMIICMIAIMLVIFFTALYKKRTSLFLLLICYGLLSFGTLPGITYIYEMRADNQLDSGTPALAYIAMGMQEAPRAAGWYNAYNYNVYVESNHDLDFVNMYSKKLINERLTHFKENPNEAFDFYFEKYVSQWCDGTYASREITAITSFDRSNFFENFYAKDGGKLYIFICNQYQNLLYLGALIFFLKGCFFPKEDSKHLASYIGILAAFGGFLFHFMWEANTRAILPYTLLLIPTASSGIAFLSAKILKKA